MSYLTEEEAVRLQEKWLCVCTCMPYEDCCGAGPCVNRRCYDEEE